MKSQGCFFLAVSLALCLSVQVCLAKQEQAAEERQKRWGYPYNYFNYDYASEPPTNTNYGGGTDSYGGGTDRPWADAEYDYYGTTTETPRKPSRSNFNFPKFSFNSPKFPTLKWPNFDQRNLEHVKIQSYVNRTLNNWFNRYIRPVLMAELLRNNQNQVRSNALKSMAGQQTGSSFERRPLLPSTRLTDVVSRRISSDGEKDESLMARKKELNAKLQGFLRNIAPFVLEKVFHG